MLMGLESTLSVGDSIEIVLRFEVSGEKTVNAVARRL
jgi:copper(I)-binding protein